MGDQSFGIDATVVATIADELREVHDLGVQLGHRHRRRQHHPRPAPPATADRARDRRLHGHARHRDQRPGAAGRAGEARRPHPRADRHRDPRGGRAVHPPPRHAPPREGARGDLRAPAPATRSSPPTRAAALRANEIRADVLLKATKVDGIYDRRSGENPDAELLRAADLPGGPASSDLRVMDAAAICLCRDNDMPIQVFDLMSRATSAAWCAASGRLGGARAGGLTRTAAV